jgi:gluconate 2-dehydrogenase gamma chain
MIRQVELSVVHKATLEEALSRLLPSDDGPGAAEAGVIDYIENALQDPWNSDFVPLLTRGLDFFEHLAGQQAGKSFVECTPEEQDQILHQVQRFPNNDARKFFQKLIDLALEGFLCDPRHGGNRGTLGWRYVGRAYRGSYCLEGGST